MDPLEPLREEEEEEERSGADREPEELLGEEREIEGEEER